MAEGRLIKMSVDITFTSSSIVRSEPLQFALEYKDEQGTLMFNGFELGHACGGMLYFPTLEEWDSFLPDRRGQRKKILVNILEFVRKKKSFGYLERSLTDLGFHARWPKESNYLGFAYKRPRVSEAEVGKFVRPLTLIDTRPLGTHVSHVRFDRPFRTQVFNLNQRETVRLCSDRTAQHATRVEVQLLMPSSKDIPDAFDDLTVEDMTDSEILQGAEAEELRKWQGAMRAISLRASEGTRRLILCLGAMFWEDDAPPGAPSKVQVPGAPHPNQY